MKPEGNINVEFRLKKILKLYKGKRRNNAFIKMFSVK